MNSIEVKVVKTPVEMQDAFYIRNRVFVEEQNNSIEENLDRFDKDANHFVLYLNNSAIGCLRIRFFEKKAEFERVCVLKNYREKGFGKELIEFAIGYCSSKTKEISLDAQVTAKKFYEKCGFTARGKEFKKFGTPHVEMFYLC